MEAKAGAEAHLETVRDQRDRAETRAKAAEQKFEDAHSGRWGNVLLAFAFGAALVFMVWWAYFKEII